MNASPSTSLAESQQALLTALFAHPGDGSAGALHAALRFQLDTDGAQAHRGWMAYRANGHALAERTLGAVYPVVAALLGSDNFDLLARDLWHRHPPTQGDLTCWGGDLAEWLAGCDTLAEVPYLADVARVEWALHRAATWPDATVDTASFARLSSEDPVALSLALVPGTTLIHSEFPVVALITAHKNGEPELSDVGAMLRLGVKQTALIWRHGLRPRLAPCPPAVNVMLSALMEGCDLVSALDATSGAESANGARFDFDFSEWLSGAVIDGLVIGVRTAAPLSSNPTESPR
ncbi:MAG TPA: DNA-binding domain-containing protein [Hydrogenophaga sp.]|nr:DNA-binding domain-containing protein [Hydrogenophaga sp.]